MDTNNTASEKYSHLLSRIREFPSAIIAFSGGLDSGFVLHATRAAFSGTDRRMLAVMALSPAVPEWDRVDASRIAEEIGAPLRLVDTDLLTQESYIENTSRRCYFCKSDLYERIEVIRKAENYAVIFNGTQTDDLGDFRPGLKAAEEHQVVSPLLDAGLTKTEIRSLAREFGLSFWNKPGSPCLASRIPHGSPVTLAALTRVQKAESALRALGFRIVRVRDHGKEARVELGPEELDRATGAAMKTRITTELRAAGFTAVEIAAYVPSGLATVLRH